MNANTSFEEIFILSGGEYSIILTLTYTGFDVSDIHNNRVIVWIAKRYELYNEYHLLCLKYKQHLQINMTLDLYTLIDKKNTI